MAASTSRPAAGCDRLRLRTNVPSPLGASRCPTGIVFEGQVRGRSRRRSCDAREASKGRRGTAFVSLSTQPKWVGAV
jgi:hypothetical protein